MFSYVSPESRIPKDHPLRPIPEMVDDALKELSGGLGCCVVGQGFVSSNVIALYNDGDAFFFLRPHGCLEGELLMFLGLLHRLAFQDQLFQFRLRHVEPHLPVLVLAHSFSAGLQDLDTLPNPGAAFFHTTGEKSGLSVPELLSIAN